MDHARQAARRGPVFALGKNRQRDRFARPPATLGGVPIERPWVDRRRSARSGRRHECPTRGGVSTSGWRRSVLVRESTRISMPTPLNSRSICSLKSSRMRDVGRIVVQRHRHPGHRPSNNALLDWREIPRLDLVHRTRIRVERDAFRAHTSRPGARAGGRAGCVGHWRSPGIGNRSDILSYFHRANRHNPTSPAADCASLGPAVRAAREGPVAAMSGGSNGKEHCNCPELPLACDHSIRFWEMPRCTKDHAEARRRRCRFS